MSSFRESPHTVSLPSIHVMFPEYLLRTPPFDKPPKHRHSLSHQPHPVPTSMIRPFAVRRSSDLPSASFPGSLAYGRGLPTLPHGINVVSSSPGQRSALPFESRPPTQQPDSDHRWTVPRSNAHSHTFSFDVLRSDPSSSSLEHLASSASYPNRGGPASQPSQSGITIFRADLSSRPSSSIPIIRPQADSRALETGAHAQVVGTDRNSPPSYPIVISFPVSNNPTSPITSNRDFSPDEQRVSGDGEDSSGGSNAKKHVCPICARRFNRPSSLRIHLNTHTGATPFRCPHPNCGREFNVNSNMRRHLRNHSNPGASRSQPDGLQRRRKRGLQTSLVFVAERTSPNAEVPSRGPFVSSPPISSLSMSDESDSDVSDMDGGVHPKEGDEVDELLEDESPHEHLDTRYSVPSSLAHRRSRISPERSPYELSYRQHYSHVRSVPRQALNSSSPSSSPSPPPLGQMYSPSAPYIRSLADLRVSTALRPAFHSRSWSTVSSHTVKEE